MKRFAHAVREELWSRGRLIESRLSCGEALEDETGIVATDARDEALVTAATGQLDRLRAVAPTDLTVRLVAEATLESVTGTMTVRNGTLSVVTDPEHVEADLDLLRRAGLRIAPPALPLQGARFLWKNGSAAVLLHEAVGHPIEHHLDPLPLPEWLRIDIPLRFRRATFRDVPLLRMEHVRVSQVDAPFDRSPEVIEIELVESGSYDPLTDRVTIRVAAPRLEIVVPRSGIAFLGASGEPVRYPGVICSREGQELVVGSWAPAVLTELR